MSDKFELDDYLNRVDYVAMQNSKHTEFAYKFMTFIKLCNYPDGESNKTPPVHLTMLDKLVNDTKYVCNLCFRGLGKTSVFAEYLFLYIACFGKLEKLGDLEGAMYVSDSMENGVKSLRKNIESRYWKSDYLQKMLPPKDQKFTDTQIEFKNAEGHEFMVKMYGATTGIRGVKMKGKRPVLCIIDDVMSDEASKSPTVLKSIKDTIYSGILPALDPNRQKVIFNGTPFNKNDVIVEAVESGEWDVNAYPVCEKFPCTKEEFHGAWPDRFTYESVMERYKLMKGAGHEDSFYQELMLRINSGDNRLVQDNDIMWYERPRVIKHLSNFNVYITTDFATSSRNSADFSVISVWGYNNNGDWYWLDGVVRKQQMNDNINDLFRLVSRYKPISVGIEVTGQQGAFLQWIHNEMIDRNQFFTLAGDRQNSGTGKEGIRPTVDKLSRFNLVVPLFKQGKIYFPTEAKESPELKEFMSELKLATRTGFKGHDDCLDTISMLAYMNPYKPSFGDNLEQKEQAVDNSVFNQANVWMHEDNESSLNSYIV